MRTFLGVPADFLLRVRIFFITRADILLHLRIFNYACGNFITAEDFPSREMII